MPTDRVNRYRMFATRFWAGRDGDPRWDLKRVPVADIERAEAGLGAKLPSSYKVFATEVGVGPFPLLGETRDWSRDRDYPIPLEHLWGPAEIVWQCGQDWLAPIRAEVSGGPAIASEVAWKYLLPFGRDDNSDYWHCFPRQPGEVDDLQVYVFDSDGGDIEQVSRGLDELIDRFLRLPAMP